MVVCCGDRSLRRRAEEIIEALILVGRMEVGEELVERVCREKRRVGVGRVLDTRERVNSARAVSSVSTNGDRSKVGRITYVSRALNSVW